MTRLQANRIQPRVGSQIDGAGRCLQIKHRQENKKQNQRARGQPGLAETQEEHFYRGHSGRKESEGESTLG
jgi:hypothetical protein